MKIIKFFTIAIITTAIITILACIIPPEQGQEIKIGQQPPPKIESYEWTCPLMSPYGNSTVSFILQKQNDGSYGCYFADQWGEHKWTDRHDIHIFLIKNDDEIHKKWRMARQNVMEASATDGRFGASGDGFRNLQVIDTYYKNKIHSDHSEILELYSDGNHATIFYVNSDIAKKCIGQPISSVITVKPEDWDGRVEITLNSDIFGSLSGTKAKYTEPGNCVKYYVK